MQAPDSPLPQTASLPGEAVPRAIRRYVATLVAGAFGTWYAGFVLVDAGGLPIAAAVVAAMLATAGRWMRNESNNGLALAALFGAASGVVLASLLNWLGFLPGSYVVRPLAALALLATACMVAPIGWPRLPMGTGFVLAAVALTLFGAGHLGFSGIVVALGAGYWLTWRTRAALSALDGERPPQHLAMAVFTRVFLPWSL